MMIATVKYIMIHDNICIIIIRALALKIYRILIPSD